MTQVKPQIAPDLTPMDYVRGALFNALHSGLTLDDVCRMSANADSPESFDRAVNMLAQTGELQDATNPSPARKTDKDLSVYVVAPFGLGIVLGTIYHAWVT